MLRTAKPLRVPACALAAWLLAASTSAAPSLEHTETVRASIGWRDNVMLSPFAPDGRPFARGEIEAFFSGERPDWRFIGLLSGDVFRYISPVSDTGGEQQWFLHAETRWQHFPAWRVGLKADTFLQDTVIDLSDVESTRTVLAARVTGAFATLAPRVALPAGFAIEPLVQVKRVHYREIPGNYDEEKLGGHLEWKRTEALAITATWLEHRRHYLERQQYTLGGRALRDTHLRFWQREGEVRFATAWGSTAKWTATTTLGRLENRDRASGFFDFDQQHAKLEFTRQAGWWKIIVEGDAKRTDYRTQTVGAGITPPPRIADAFEARLRVERTLSLNWLLFAEHTWERDRSNEREFSYRANTVLAGVQRDF